MVTLRRAGGATGTGGDFNIDELTYPIDLFQEDKKHMVVFFINVPGKSKIGDAANTLFSGAAPMSKKSGTGNIGKAAANAGITSMTVGGQTITFAPGYKQLKSAIAMYMPNNWVESWSAKYEQADSNAIINLLSREANKSGGQVTDAISSMAGSMANRFAQGTVGNILAAITSSKEVANKLQGKLSNPNSESIFNGMNFRTFTFEFLMAPRSRTEAGNVIRIIDTFKYHMHPEITSGEYLIFPAEFEIDFYSGTKNNDSGTRQVNQFIGSIATCALTDMSVNYTPDGVWSAFKDTNGYPTAVTMSLTFTELEPLTKDRLDEFGEGPTTSTGVSDAAASFAADNPIGSAAGIINARDRT